MYLLAAYLIFPCPAWLLDERVSDYSIKPHDITKILHQMTLLSALRRFETFIKPTMFAFAYCIPFL